MARFITLAGKKQTGKDTSAQYIKHVLKGKRVHVVHFADALKKACSEIFGIPLEDMETEIGKQRVTDVAWPFPYEHGFGDAELRVDGIESKTQVWVPYTHNGPLSWHHPQTHQGAEGPSYMTVREILQFVGTNLFRNQMDPDVWVKSVYRKRYRDDDIVVVADCRFPNEAEFARERGLLIGVQRETGLACDGHASETALDRYSDYHYTIDNNGSFMDLHQHLDTILRLEGFLA